jgi:hypothetical protein
MYLAVCTLLSTAVSGCKRFNALRVEERGRVSGEAHDKLRGVGRKRQRRYTGKPLFGLGLPKRPVPD